MSPITEALTKAYAAALDGHPNPSAVPGTAQALLDVPSNGVLNRTRACLEAATGTTAVLMAMAQYLEDNDASDQARCIRLFAQSFAMVEAASI